jgi:hypothetical protein
MAGNFRVQSMTILPVGRSSDKIGQSLRVELALSDQEGEQTPATETVAISVAVTCADHEKYTAIQHIALNRAISLLRDSIAELPKPID